MEKHIESDDVAQDWNRVLRDVAEDENTIIIEQSGEPIAVLLPIRQYHHIQRTREITESIESARSLIDRRRTEIRDEIAD